MPGPWYPFSSNEGGDEAMRETFRKRRAIDCEDSEISDELQVSPKCHRPMRNTMSPGRKYGFGNIGAHESLPAFGFIQLPFSPQTDPVSTGQSTGSPMTFFGSYDQGGSPASVTAMDTDEGYVSEQSIIAAPPATRTPEKHFSRSMSGSPELYQQFCMNGYSPSLIERVIEERRISAGIGTPIDGRAYPVPGESPSQERTGSITFACRMFPRHSDVY